MKKIFKNGRGITLIALIVTIIILLVLAGISIRLITGQDGILARATNSRNKHLLESKKEEVELAIEAKLIENLYDKSKVTISSVVEEIQKNYSNEEKNGINGISTSDEAEENAEYDYFRGVIVYSGKAAEGLNEIVVEVDDLLHVERSIIGSGKYTLGTDEYSNVPKVQPSDSKYTKVGKICVNSPDLSGFNPANTYYVTYDSNGNNETIAGRIDRITPNANLVGEKSSNVWYDYENKIWANIVTVEEDRVTYWTWIPRYVYKTNADDSTIASRKG